MTTIPGVIWLGIGIVVSAVSFFSGGGFSSENRLVLFLIAGLIFSVVGIIRLVMGTVHSMKFADNLSEAFWDAVAGGIFNIPLEERKKLNQNHGQQGHGHHHKGQHAGQHHSKQHHGHQHQGHQAGQHHGRQPQSPQHQTHHAGQQQNQQVQTHVQDQPTEIAPKYCLSCGQQLPGNASFCSSCGSQQ